MSDTDVFLKWNHFQRELLRIFQEYDVACYGRSAAECLQIRREENKALSEACFRHKRELDLLAGEKVEPIAQEASATLVAIVGGSSG